MATLLTINPALLDDDQAFSYRDLQRLCKRIGLGGNGKRVVLVERLRTWNRERPAQALCDENSPLPMNVPGQHFALLNIHVSAGPRVAPEPGHAGGDKNADPAAADAHAAPASKRRRSLVGGAGGAHDTAEHVSPRLLRPLERADAIETPRSIMKSAYVATRRSLPLVASFAQNFYSLLLCCLAQGARPQKPDVLAIQRRANHPASPRS